MVISHCSIEQIFQYTTPFPQSSPFMSQETLKPQRILLLEDDPAQSAFISAYLSSNGFDVTIAENGEEAIRKASSNNYDILLSDMDLPDIDGKTVVSTLRDNPDLNPLNIAFLSSFAMNVQDKAYGYITVNEVRYPAVPKTNIGEDLLAALGSFSNE